MSETNDVDCLVMSDFDKGARAMFDYFACRAANNYHGNSETDKICQKENELIMDLAEDALEDVSPESCATWKTITDLQNKIALLERSDS